MVNSVKLKIFLVWLKIQPKTTEIIFSPYFHFKPFPPLSHTHSSLTHALPPSKLDYSDPQTEPNGTIHTDAPRSRSRRSPELRRSASIAIIEIGEIAIVISPRKCDLFWVLFVFLGINDIMCLFGSWENVRKCEQQVENVFSMVFSRIQPNIRKYFPKIFLKCNQTHENIFFSEK